MTDGAKTCNTPGCGKPITFQRKESGEGWDRFNPDGTPHTHPRGGGGGGGFRGRSAEELRDIRREVALKAAVDYAVSRTDMKGADVLKLAKAFAEWIEHP